MSRIDVPNGWVELREPEAVPERLRRPVVQAITAMASDSAAVQAIQAADTPEDAAEHVPALMGAMSAMQDAAIVALVSAWSFGDTVTLDALLDLPGGTYDAISTLCMPLMEKMLPDFGPDPDPKATTA